MTIALADKQYGEAAVSPKTGCVWLTLNALQSDDTMRGLGVRMSWAEFARFADLVARIQGDALK